MRPSVLHSARRTARTCCDVTAYWIPVLMDSLTCAVQLHHVLQASLGVRLASFAQTLASSLQRQDTQAYGPLPRTVVAFVTMQMMVSNECALHTADTSCSMCFAANIGSQTVLLWVSEYAALFQ